MRIDLGKKEITNHSFPTELNSIGHPCLKAKSPKHPHRLSLGAGVSVRSRVTGSQLHAHELSPAGETFRFMWPRGKKWVSFGGERTAR